MGANHRSQVPTSYEKPETRRVQAVKADLTVHAVSCEGLFGEAASQHLQRGRERALKAHLNVKASVLCGFTNDALCLLSFV